MEGEDHGVGVLLVDQRVLHLRGGHAQKRVGVLLAGLVEHRGVDQPGDAAGRVEDRHRHAGEVGVAGEVVLGAADRDRRSFAHGEAERVGAALLLAPDAAWQDRAPGGALGEAPVAHRVEDDAVEVGEGDHEVRAGDLRVQELHLGEGEATEEGALLAPPGHLGEG